MSSYYIYLISSLPMLHFDEKAPFSFDRFLEMCRELIPADDLELIKLAARLGIDICPTEQPTLKIWCEFETTLRNELVKVRAVRRKIDPSRYTRRNGFVDSRITQLAINAVRNPSILEAERILDQGRWRVLDELSLQHYFDIDLLIVYALRLLILEKWDRVNTADTRRLVEETLAPA